jgi:hypothetical protein
MVGELSVRLLRFPYRFASLDTGVIVSEATYPPFYTTYKIHWAAGSSTLDFGNFSAPKARVVIPPVGCSYGWQDEDNRTDEEIPGK